MDELSRIDSHHQPHRIDTTQHYAKASLPFQQKSASRVRGASQQHENGLKGAPVATVSYYNYMDRDIVVTGRNGTAVVVQPIGKYTADEFIVCVTHSMTRSAMERALDTLRSRANVDDRETHCWIRAYEATLHNHTHDSLSASVEYVIYFRDICDAGGRCYMPDVDLLVEWLADRGSMHPFDKVKRDEAMVMDMAPGIGEATCVFMIKAVDNAHQVQRATRYINLGGDIFMVPIERDLKYSTGIHVVSRTPLQNGEAVSDVIHRSFTFEEADEKFGLHRSIEDAINGGPLDAMARLIIERETTERRVGEAKMRTGHLEQEEELQRLKNEAALYKAQQDKDAAARRNYVEWAKTAVAVLGAIVTVYGILSKLKS